MAKLDKLKQAAPTHVPSDLASVLDDLPDPSELGMEVASPAEEVSDEPIFTSDSKTAPEVSLQETPVPEENILDSLPDPSELGMDMGGSGAVPSSDNALLDSLPDPSELGMEVGEETPYRPDNDKMSSAQGVGGDLARGFKAGVLETLLPFSDRAAKESPDSSYTELGSNLVASMASDITAGSVATTVGSAIGGTLGSVVPGAGTAIGAAAGGLLGGAAYAVYSGVGAEYLQAKRSGKDFNWGKAAARSALNLNPIARVEARAAKALGEAAEAGSKIAAGAKKAAELSEKGGVRAARAIGQVGGAAAVAADDAGATAGIIGGALAAAGVAPAFVHSNLAPTPSQIKTMGEFYSAPVGRNMMESIEARATREIPKDLVVTDEMKYDPKFMDYVLTAPLKGETRSSLSGKSDKVKRQLMDKVIADAETGGMDEAKLADYYKGFMLKKISDEEAVKTNMLLTRRLDTALDELRTTPKTSENAGKRDALRGKVSELESLDKDPLKGSTQRVIAAAQRASQVARKVDNVTGLGMGRVIDTATEKLNLYQRVASGLSTLALDATKLQKKARLSNEDIGRLRITLSDRDGFDMLTPELRKIVSDDFRITDKKVDAAMRAWDKVWERSRTEVENYGFKLGQIKHYLPMRRLPRDLLAIQMRRSLDTLKGVKAAIQSVDPSVKDITQINADNIQLVAKAKNLSSKEVSNILAELEDIQEMVKRSQGKSVLRKMTDAQKEAFEAMSPEDKIMSFTNALLNDRSAKGMGFEMTALYTRGASKIPENYRDLDNGRAFQRYLNLNVRGAMMDDTYRQIRDFTEVLESARLPDSAQYFRSWLNEMTGEGSEAGLAGVFNSSARQYRYNIEKYFDASDFDTSDGVGKALKDAALFVPEMMAKAHASVYPSYLGGNVRNAVRGLLQPIQTLAPELGGAYGMKTTMAAYIDSIKAARTPEGKLSWNKLKEDLDKLGLMGRGPLENLSEDGMDNGVLKKFNEWTMGMMTCGDIVNRYVTYQAGKRWAADLIAGDPSAVRALSELAPSVRGLLKSQGMQTAIKEGDADKVGDTLGKFLVSKTQFHYSSEQKSELQRLMGPFAQFTTWPTEMLGNALEQATTPNHPLAKIQKMNRYFLQPWLATYGAMYLMELDEYHPGVLAYTIGADFMSSTAASTALQFKTDMWLGSFWPALAIEAGKTAASMAEGKPKKEALENLGQKTLKKTITTVMPPVSSAINELDRFKKRYQGKKEGVSDKITRNLIKGDFWNPIPAAEKEIKGLFGEEVE